MCSVEHNTSKNLYLEAFFTFFNRRVVCKIYNVYYLIYYWVEKKSCCDKPSLAVRALLSWLIEYMFAQSSNSDSLFQESVLYPKH